MEGHELHGDQLLSLLSQEKYDEILLKIPFPSFLENIFEIMTSIHIPPHIRLLKAKFPDEILVYCVCFLSHFNSKNPSLLGSFLGHNHHHLFHMIRICMFETKETLEMSDFICEEGKLLMELIVSDKAIAELSVDVIACHLQDIVTPSTIAEQDTHFAHLWIGSPSGRLSKPGHWFSQIKRDEDEDSVLTCPDPVNSEYLCLTLTKIYKAHHDLKPSVLDAFYWALVSSNSPLINSYIVSEIMSDCDLPPHILLLLHFLFDTNFIDTSVCGDWVDFAKEQGLKFNPKDPLVKVRQQSFIVPSDTPQSEVDQMDRRSQRKWRQKLKDMKKKGTLGAKELPLYSTHHFTPFSIHPKHLTQINVPESMPPEININVLLPKLMLSLGTALSILMHDQHFPKKLVKKHPHAVKALTFHSDELPENIDKMDSFLVSKVRNLPFNSDPRLHLPRLDPYYVLQVSKHFLACIPSNSEIDYYFRTIASFILRLVKFPHFAESFVDAGIGPILFQIASGFIRILSIPSSPPSDSNTPSYLLDSLLVFIDLCGTFKILPSDKHRFLHFIEGSQLLEIFYSVLMILDRFFGFTQIHSWSREASDLILQIFQSLEDLTLHYHAGPILIQNGALEIVDLGLKISKMSATKVPIVIMTKCILIIKNLAIEMAVQQGSLNSANDMPALPNACCVAITESGAIESLLELVKEGIEQQNPNATSELRTKKKKIACDVLIALGNMTRSKLIRDYLSNYKGGWWRKWLTAQLIYLNHINPFQSEIYAELLSVALHLAWDADYLQNCIKDQVMTSLALGIKRAKTMLGAQKQSGRKKKKKEKEKEERKEDFTYQIIIFRTLYVMAPILREFPAKRPLLLGEEIGYLLLDCLDPTDTSPTAENIKSSALSVLHSLFWSPLTIFPSPPSQSESLEILESFPRLFNRTCVDFLRKAETLLHTPLEQTHGIRETIFHISYAFSSHVQQVVSLRDSNQTVKQLMIDLDSAQNSDPHFAQMMDTYLNFLKRVCTVCKKRDSAVIKLRKCARCHSVLYCSKDCQAKDWSKHKLECKKLQASRKS